MAFRDNEKQINNLTSSNNFLDWYNKFNDEVIAKLNMQKVFTGASGDGIDVFVGTTLGTAGGDITAGDMLVSLSGNVTKGITFNNVTVNGILNATNIEGASSIKFLCSTESANGTAGFTFGRVVRMNSDAYEAGGSGGTLGHRMGITLARGTNTTEAEAIGVVSDVSGNSVTVATQGKIQGPWNFGGVSGGLTYGCVFFLDPQHRGILTKTEPTNTGLVSKPMIIGVTGDTGVIVNYRGQELGLTGASGAAATSLVSIIDIGTAVSGTDLNVGVGRVVSRKTDAITDTSGNFGGGRKIYNGVYLASGDDPYTNAGDHSSTGTEAYGNEIIGVITGFPAGTGGQLIEVTSIGIFTPASSSYDTNNTDASPVFLKTSTTKGTASSLGLLTKNPGNTVIAYRMSDTQLYCNIRSAGGGASPPITLASTTSTEQSKNALINGSYRVWQRGTSFVGSTSGNGFYFADRWATMNGITSKNGAARGSLSISRSTFTRGQTGVAGSPKYYATFANGMTGLLVGANDYYHVEHRIDDSTVFMGNNVNVSFYAKSSVNGTTLSTKFKQYFHGSETGDKEITDIGTATLTNYWQEYTQSFNVPGLSSGYTITDKDDYSALAFDIRAHESKTLDLAQVRLYVGTDSFPDIENERIMVNACSEFYQKSYDPEVAPRTRTMYTNFLPDTSTVVFDINDKRRKYIEFPIKMKRSPTITVYSPTDGYTGDALNISATNRSEALPLRQAAGTQKTLLGQKLVRSGSVGDPTLETNTTSSNTGFVLNIKQGSVFSDQIGLHYVADGDSNINFKRVT